MKQWMCWALCGLFLTGCQDKPKTVVPQGPGVNEKPQTVGKPAGSQLQSESVEKSQLIGTPVSVKTLELQGLHVTGFEGPAGYSQAEKEMTLVLDKSFREIGFRTKRTDLGDGVSLLAQSPEGKEYRGTLALQTHYMGEKAGVGTLVYGGWFSPQAGSTGGLWKFKVLHLNQVLFTQELEVLPEDFSLAKETSSGPFDRHGSYEARYGEKFTVTFRAAKPGDERLILYFMDYEKPFKTPGGRTVTQLTPVLAVDAPVKNGVAQTILVLGRDLAPGSYKVGIGTNPLVVRAFDSMIHIKD